MPANHRLVRRAGIAAAVLLLGASCSDGGEDRSEPSDTTTTAEPDDTTTTETTGGDDDTAADCLLPDDVVGEIVGDDVVESGASFGGFSYLNGDQSIDAEYEGCDYQLASGPEVEINELVDTDDGSAADAFEQLRGLIGVDEDVTDVPDLGDSALLEDEQLFVRAGDRVFNLEIEPPAVPFDPSSLEALAVELLAVDGMSTRVGSPSARAGRSGT